MQLTRLRIANWKNFRAADVHIGRRLFLIGPNASGKSNFLDAFRFLRDVSTVGLRGAVEARGGVSSLRCLAAKRDNRITVAVEIKNGNDILWKYELVFLQDNNQHPIVDSEKVWQGDKQLLDRPDAHDRADPERRTQTALEQIAANQSFRQVSQFFKTFTYLHLIPQVVKDPAGFTAAPVQDDPFGRDFLLRVWNTNRNTTGSRLSRITAALKIAVPQLQSLDVVQDETGKPHLQAVYANWRAHGASQWENQFSDGTLRLLGLLWLTYEGSGPLLIEEPELSLHPEIVRLLPQMFERINRSRKEPRQIFISTHSPELLGDKGIAAEEVMRLEPTSEGTVIMEAAIGDKEAMKAGLSAAEVLLPQSAPRDVQQLTLAL